MFPRLKLITFDAKDTIMELTKSQGEHYADVSRRLGVQVLQSEEQSLTSSFKTAFASIQKEYPCFGKDVGMSLTDWWVLVVQKTFRDSNFSEERISSTLMKDIAVLAFNEFATSVCWRVKGDAVEALTSIRSLRPEVTLGVVSNGDNRLEYLLEQLGLLELVDFVVDSYSAAAEKPDKRIFDVALSKSKLSVSDVRTEALHVGDDVEQDYLASKRAGWSSLLLKTQGNSTSASNLFHASQGFSSSSESSSFSVGKEASFQEVHPDDLILSLTQVIHM